MQRRSIPFAQWPARDREAWTLACAPGDILDSTLGYASRWKESTRALIEAGYGHWLASLARTGRLDRTAPPGARATRANLDAYRVELRAAGLADNTVAGRLQQLADMLRAIAPEGDWAWIHRASSRIASKAVLVRDPVERMQPPAAIMKLAEDMMASAETDRFRMPVEKAVLFRDGLMIAFLIRRPLRSANLHDLALDTSLELRGDTWRMHFEAKDVKNGIAIDMIWPQELVGALERYLEVHRPVLLKTAKKRQAPTRALWISKQGSPMNKATIGLQVSARTKAEFGKPINPHTFRHIAATAIATSTPEAAMEIATVLGHDTIKTAEKYYNRAEILGAGTTYQGSLAAYRGAKKRNACRRTKPLTQ